VAEGGWLQQALARGNRRAPLRSHHRSPSSGSDSAQPEDRSPGRLRGAQPDGRARQAGVAAHRLNDSDSRRPTSVSRFAHQSRGDPLFAWEGLGYYGTDHHRLWVNTRGETNRDRGGLERAELQVLYSRLLGYYWDIQAGVRHDFRIDPRDGTPARTYGVFGLQGLAPGFFEVQLHGFIGQEGVFVARASVSYDLLITNRLVLQPEAELNFASGWDREALISPGLYRIEAGIRLRYEITREFAPYIGFSYESYTGGATGLNRRIGEKPSQSTIVAGIRLVF
jgi:copper resistance protein B